MPDPLVANVTVNIAGGLVCRISMSFKSWASCSEVWVEPLRCIKACVLILLQWIIVPYSYMCSISQHLMSTVTITSTRQPPLLLE